MGRSNDVPKLRNFVRWPSLAAACLSLNSCHQKQEQSPGPSITVQLPAPHPYAPRAPVPGFSNDALDPSFEEPPAALAAPSEEVSQNSL